MRQTASAHLLSGELPPQLDNHFIKVGTSVIPMVEVGAEAPGGQLIYPSPPVAKPGREPRSPYSPSSAH